MCLLLWYQTRRRQERAGTDPVLLQVLSDNVFRKPLSLGCWVTAKGLDLLRGTILHPDHCSSPLPHARKGQCFLLSHTCAHRSLHTQDSTLMSDIPLCRKKKPAFSYPRICSKHSRGSCTNRFLSLNLVHPLGRSLMLGKWGSSVQQQENTFLTTNTVFLPVFGLLVQFAFQMSS